MKLRVSHYQCQIEPAEYERNIQKVIGALEHAEREQVDILSVPESMLTGYFDSEERAREHAFSVDDSFIADFLKRIAHFKSICLVGLNERRGDDLYNSVLIVQQGRILDVYSKAFLVYPYFTPGRHFPVFETNGVKWGVVICADGGFIEPARILALKGARLIMAPHNNYINTEHVLDHYLLARAEHAARASENGIFFLRGNNVVHGKDKGILYDGVGYGDSYLLDPYGQVFAASRLHTECYLTAEIDFAAVEKHGYPFGRWRSIAGGLALHHELGEALRTAAREDGDQFAVALDSGRW